mmetsp:Transcript_23404/g.65791  ORF Transcript_23404/g.65791 Transcript_23404/m.65791 type:complete len:122 (+) Transcript_23404:44-409(+)
MQKHEESSTHRGCESPTESQTSTGSDFTDIYSYMGEKDLGYLYAEIMQVCQPFYALPVDSGGQSINIPPRLEDGLRQKESSERAYSGQENPQDSMNSSSQCISQTFLSQTNSHAFHQFDDQ